MATGSDRPVSLAVPPGAAWVHDAVDEPGRPYLLLALSDEMNDRIERLAIRADVSKAELINRAIGLYKALADASDEGKRVGVVSDPDVEFETEFLGF